MFETTTLFTVSAVFLLAGTVKGVIGLGLPSVSLALLSLLLDLPTAMAILLAPALLTNIWQAFTGGNGVNIVRRTWPFLLTACTTVWLGAMALSRLDLSLLSALLGLLLFTYAAISLSGVRISVSPGGERWAGPLLGSINGVFTGMTGSFVVPGVMYLQAIGLPRDMLIQAMGMLFSVSALALGIALQQNNFLSTEQGYLSIAATLPAIIGMAFGQRIRKRLPEQTFRKVFFIALLALGAYIVVNALLRL